MFGLRAERDAWLRARQFPREYAVRVNGNFFRGGYVVSWDELSALLRYYDNQDIHLGLFTTNQIAENRYDTVLWDIDGHDGDYLFLWERVRKVLDRLEELGLRYRVYFTGRGFNVYVDFVEREFNDYKYAMRSWSKEILGDLSEYLDWRVVGDITKDPKLVGVKNSLVGYYVVGVSVDMEIDKILRNAIINKQVSQRYEPQELDFDDYDRGEEEFEREEEIKLVQDDVDDVGVMVFKSELDFPDCIHGLMKKLRETGRLSHDEKFHLRTFLLRVWDCRKVYRLFKRYMRKFNEDRVKYQLTYAVENDYKPYSCKMARDLGICPFDDLMCCPFYYVSSGALYRILGSMHECDFEDEYGRRDFE